MNQQVSSPADDHQNNGSNYSVATGAIPHFDVLGYNVGYRCSSFMGMSRAWHNTIVREHPIPVHPSLNTAMSPGNHMKKIPKSQPAAAVPCLGYRMVYPGHGTQPPSNTIGPSDGINNYPKGAALPTLQRINNGIVPGTSTMGMNQQRYCAPNRFPSTVAPSNNTNNSLGRMDTVLPDCADDVKKERKVVAPPPGFNIKSKKAVAPPPGLDITKMNQQCTFPPYDHNGNNNVYGGFSTSPPNSTTREPAAAPHDDRMERYGYSTPATPPPNSTNPWEHINNFPMREPAVAELDDAMVYYGCSTPPEINRNSPWNNINKCPIIEPATALSGSDNELGKYYMSPGYGTPSFSKIIGSRDGIKCYRRGAALPTIMEE